MSIAAEGPKGWDRFVAALPFLLLSLYPIVWIALYAWSWRLMGRGSIGWAFALSSIPVVLSVVGVTLFFRSDQPKKGDAGPPSVSRPDRKHTS
jgi:hypothetical protein